MLIFTFCKERHLTFVLFRARTMKRCSGVIALVTTISKMWNVWLIIVRAWAWKKFLLNIFVVVKFANFLSHDGNQYRKKRRKETIQNLISFSPTFWDQCQLLRLVTIDTIFLFTDSYNSYSAVYFLKPKEERLDKLCFFVHKWERLEPDNGKEYISKRIKREYSAP